MLRASEKIVDTARSETNYEILFSVAHVNQCLDNNESNLKVFTGYDQ